MGSTFSFFERIDKNQFDQTPILGRGISTFLFFDQNFLHVALVKINCTRFKRKLQNSYTLWDKPQGLDLVSQGTMSFLCHSRTPKKRKKIS